MNRLIGTTLLVTGTTIGAGMLALPITIALLGLIWGSVAIVLMWAFMTYGALVLLEANITAKDGLPVSILARRFIGHYGEVLAVLTMLILFWSLLAAYLTGSVSLLQALCDTLGIDFGLKGLATGATVFFGACLLARLEWLDGVNRVFIVVKAAAFVGMIGLLLPMIIKGEPLGVPAQVNQLEPWALALPVLFTAFGFHGSIHSLVRYAKLDVKTLKKAFIIGSLIPLVVYLLWIWVSLGALQNQNPEAFDAFVNGAGTIGDFTAALTAKTNGVALNACIWVFSLLAIFTSALGVALGLFDMFIEKIRGVVPSAFTHRLLSAVLTLILPLIITICSPSTFISALRFAAIYLSFIAIIFPCWMVLRARGRAEESSYHVKGGKLGLSLALMGGLLVVGLECYNLFLAS